MKREKPKKTNSNSAYIEGAGIVAEEKITETLEKNYMPYAMSVIISRALPEIDGFKPSHRKLLYTMYKMGLLSGQRTKSANVVGQTMKLNPHGDAAIYETMVRLSRGNETLLHPYVDSKGNFGKSYSRDMAYAASRYTEVKLDAICNELFRDIDKNTVDFVPNYDNTLTEPSLLPATFPSILVNANVGIAVSMASAVCPFNLSEVCETCIELMKNPCHDIMTTLKAPDFPGGAYIIKDEKELRKIYETGRGSIKIRAKYTYDKSANCIEVTEIPYTTTVEAIMDKLVELIKQNKIREISYIRDETDLSGLKLAIDLKRGTNPDMLMKKLFRLTPLQDTYSCNFNILINGTPKVMGIAEILNEWINFRENCIKRRTVYELDKKQEKLHLLSGMKKILMDIDKAVKTVRETKNDDEVVPELMRIFGIDEKQAEYVAEIKLRHLNKDYIVNRIQEIEQLEKDIAEMQDIINNPQKIKKIIASELKAVSRKYGKDRKTTFADVAEDEEISLIEEVPDYAVKLFLTESGYFKKITPLSLRMGGEQKLKDGDRIIVQADSSNHCELLFFTDMQQVYKAKLSAFDDMKASLMGEFIPSKLGFDKDENIASMIITKDYSGFMIFAYENGKIAKIPLNAYETKTNRRKLTGAYSGKSGLVKMMFIAEDCELTAVSSNGKAVSFSTELLAETVSRISTGVQVMKLKGSATLKDMFVTDEKTKKFKVATLPAVGGTYKMNVDEGQMSIL